MSLQAGNLKERTDALSREITEPFPASRKIYISGSRPDIRVPMREISQHDTHSVTGIETNPPVTVYDTSGPYTDPDMVATLITDSEIPEPLVPPASAFDYKLGKAYVLHIEHPRGNAMLVGSAGFVPGLLEGLDVDVLFLGVGGLGGAPCYGNAGAG